MATIRNVSRRALEFPSGAFLDAGASSGSIPDDDMKHPVVKGWLAEGQIEVEGEKKVRVAEGKKPDPKGE